MAMTGKENPNVVLATVITSYAASAVLTGIVFFLLGAFKLGSLVNFFPRHILKGCIGGVGFFLFVTGIEVSARLEGNLAYDLNTLQELSRPDRLVLWLPPLVLACSLTWLKGRWTSEYLVPCYFIGITALFYILVAAIPSLNLNLLREHGFIFEKVEAGVPWYHFYSYYGKRTTDNERRQGTDSWQILLLSTGKQFYGLYRPCLPSLSSAFCMFRSTCLRSESRLVKIMSISTVSLLHTAFLMRYLVFAEAYRQVNFRPPR